MNRDILFQKCCGNTHDVESLHSLPNAGYVRTSLSADGKLT